MKKRLLTLLVGCVVLTSAFVGCDNKKGKEADKEPAITTPANDEDNKNSDKSSTKESDKDQGNTLESDDEKTEE